MSTLLRWFSPAYRYALQAEAEGRYIDAARAYALCGQRLKVAEMHLLEAERRGAPASVLRELHVAAHFIDGRDEASQALRLRLGRLYLRVLKKTVLTPGERELGAEAGELLLAGGDAAAAGEAFELAGNLERAAAAYEQAGDIERVESLLGLVESRRQAGEAERQSFAAYQAHLALGQRDDALAALRRYAESATDGREGQRLLADLRARRPPAGQLRLRHVAAPEGTEPTGDVCYVGRSPLVLGRGPAADDRRTPLLALGDLGLSREHAQLDCQLSDGEVAFSVRDLGSKNGTTLGGLSIAGSLPLRGSGELGLGGQVALRYVVAGPRLDLTVGRGLSRGLQAALSPLPIPLAGGLLLEFTGADGQASVRLAAGGELLLNGRRVPARIQPLRGDAIEAGGHRYEVQ